MVIAIDGPVAAGKTSIANRLAAHFGFSLLDTGAIYRCVALRCRQQQVELSNEEAVAAIASDLPIEFHHDGKTNRVLLARTDVSDAIRMEEGGDSKATHDGSTDETQDVATDKIITPDGEADSKTTRDASTDDNDAG